MSFSQWSSTDGKIYYPAGKVVKNLPPGYYTIGRSPYGTYFEKNSLKTEGLVKFPDSDSDRVVEEINKFWTLEPKFKKSDVPFKRGILLYGPPGSGKTCTLRQAINSMIESHAGIVADFEDTYMVKAGYELIRQIHPTMPIIFLMEDFDAILRNNNESEMLNLLDGMYNIDKVIFLATTNYPEKLGSRIMNRPSRFDKRFFIGMPSEGARKAYLLSKNLTEEDAEKWARDTDGFSIAHLKELFVAHKIFGESYESALKVLRAMNVGPSSQSFDKYIIASDQPRATATDGPYRGERALGESKVKQDKYALFGTGKPYNMMKKIINDGDAPIDNIAGMISEDIRRTNGLV
jgi:hypothetical protein